MDPGGFFVSRETILRSAFVNVGVSTLCGRIGWPTGGKNVARLCRRLLLTMFSLSARSKKQVARMQPSFASIARLVTNETILALARDEQIAADALSRVGLYAEGLAASNDLGRCSGKRTATGKPLLANDPHLSASAPSIWHMVHLTALPEYAWPGSLHQVCRE